MFFRLKAHFEGQKSFKGRVQVITSMMKIKLFHSEVGELNEPSTSTKFSPTPQVNEVMEGTKRPHGSGDSETD